MTRAGVNVLALFRELVHKGQSLVDRKWIPYLGIFSLFTVIRGIAEVYAGPYPSGWDCMNYYAPWTINYAKYGLINQHFFAAPPLIFLILLTIYGLTGNVFFALKVLSPVLYGLVGVGSFYFASSYLKWEKKKSLICSLVLMCQLGALRISWDLLKNELGLALLLFLLATILNEREKRSAKSKALVIILSCLTVLSHQFVSVIYFVVLGFLLLTRKFGQIEAKRLVLLNLLAIILFLANLSIYSEWQLPISISPPGGELYFHRTIYFLGSPTFSIFWDYLQVYSSYSHLASDILLLFTILYLSILPLVIFGFWNDPIMTPFTTFLLIGAFLPLASPRYALLEWSRWMFILSYPFSIYATNALFSLKSLHKESIVSKIRQTRNKNIKAISTKLAKRMKIYVYLLIIFIYAISYAKGDLGPLLLANVPGYIPSSMTDASTPQVAIPDVIDNINSLNEFYLINSAPVFSDDFINMPLNTSKWRWTGTGAYSINQSSLTLDTNGTKRNAFISHDWGTNNKGIIEIKHKFNRYTSEAKFLDFIVIRNTGGCGGGVIYHNSNGKFSYWDNETCTSYDLIPQDNYWHLWKIVCNGTHRKIYVDDRLNLTIPTGKFFGYVELGENAMLPEYGGSSSFDFFNCSIDVRPTACLILSFRDTGITWIYLHEKIDMIVYVKNLTEAITYAVNQNYTYIFFLTYTDYSSSPPKDFVIFHQGNYYSIHKFKNQESDRILSSSISDCC